MVPDMRRKDPAVSLAQRFERRLESLVGGAFARVFKGQVEPVEIGTALQREATDKRTVVGHGQVMAPNRYRVTLSPSDFERLEPWEAQLTNSLAELVQEHLDENGWSTVGDIEVYLARDDTLHTGVFGVASRTDAKAPPRRRPFDSLSLPVVPGREPGDYAGNPSAQPAYAAPAGPVAPPGPAGPPGPPAAAVPSGPPQWSSYRPAEQPAPSRYEPPSPGARRNGAAIVVENSDRRLDLRVGSNLVGRGSDADLQLPDQGVSRRHLDIQYDGTQATAYDLGSTNGTAINGHLVGRQQLRHGDVIRIGNSRLVFLQDGA
jgi:hypothetical protein